MAKENLYKQKIKSLVRHKKGGYSNKECAELAEWLSTSITKFYNRPNVACVDVPFLTYLHNWLLERGWDIGLLFIRRFDELKNKYAKQS